MCSTQTVDLLSSRRRQNLEESTQQAVELEGAAFRPAAPTAAAIAGETVLSRYLGEIQIGGPNGPLFDVILASADTQNRQLIDT